MNSVQRSQTFNFTVTPPIRTGHGQPAHPRDRVELTGKPSETLFSYKQGHLFVHGGEVTRTSKKCLTAVACLSGAALGMNVGSGLGMALATACPMVVGAGIGLCVATANVSVNGHNLLSPFAVKKDDSAAAAGLKHAGNLVLRTGVGALAAAVGTAVAPVAALALGCAGLAGGLLVAMGAVGKLMPADIPKAA